mgnify:CR=1 FL=1
MTMKMRDLGPVILEVFKEKAIAEELLTQQILDDAYSLTVGKGSGEKFSDEWTLEDVIEYNKHKFPVRIYGFLNVSILSEVVCFFLFYCMYVCIEINVPCFLWCFHLFITSKKFWVYATVTLLQPICGVGP